MYVIKAIKRMVGDEEEWWQSRPEARQITAVQSGVMS